MKDGTIKQNCERRKKRMIPYGTVLQIRMNSYVLYYGTVRYQFFIIANPFASPLASDFSQYRTGEEDLCDVLNPT